jgi:hypothetical protein
MPANGCKETDGAMKLITKCALLLIPALVLMSPAFALPPAGLSDSGQPGSVIIYPKFVNLPAVSVDGISVPRTEIEIGAVCPPAFVAAGNACAEHQPVTVSFHWVCPGAESVNSNICPEEDFQVNLTVPGVLAFSADGTPINSNSPLVPAAPCPRGYLIGSAQSNLPINFDGLIGNAVIRGGNLAAGPNAGSSTAVSAYQAITIQANTAITGGQIGDVRFDKTTAAAPLPNVLSRTSLIFLTLNVAANQPNDPTLVNLDFWNESLGNAVGSTNPAFEHLTSSSVEFVCWVQVPLSALAGGNLTQSFQGTRKGVVVAGPAQKLRDGHAPGDRPGPVTLIGLVETVEGTAANSFEERKYNFNMSANGALVPTRFVPLPSFP